MEFLYDFGVPMIDGAGFLANISLFIYVFRGYYITKSIHEESDMPPEIACIFIGFFTLVIGTVFIISLHDGIQSYQERRGARMSNRGLIKRSEISNMLKQYQRDDWSISELTSADLEFIKSLLLQVKAKLIYGLQNGKIKRNAEINEFQFSFADKCIRSIREGHLYRAIECLRSIYECSTFFKTYCSYCELVMSVLLISNIIEMCDAQLARIKKASTLLAGSNFVLEAVSDAQRLNDLDIELDIWHNWRPEESLADFFQLTNEENNYVQKSVSEAFRAIVFCRKNKVSMREFIENTQNKISCFFSVLGASQLPETRNEIHKKQGEYFENHHSEIKD